MVYRPYNLKLHPYFVGMKYYLFLFFSVLLNFGIWGQTTSPTAIVSAGNAVTIQGTYVSWSVGETFVSTLSAPQVILTQGFQQPEIDLDVDNDGFTVVDDCDDNNAAINQAAVEICDGLDNNCNTDIDEGVLNIFFADTDNDGFGDALTSAEFCVVQPGYSSDNSDCDDTNALINSSATEVCGNGIDEDCSGADLVCALTGCTDPTAINYNASATIDDGSCIPTVLGCTDATAFNFNANANVDDGSCVPVVLGCIDATAFNFNAQANTDDGSCIPVILGCLDPTMFNYNPDANTDSGICIPFMSGCTDSTACNFDAAANVDNGSCVLPQIELCNGIDDNCNGQIDEGLTLESVATVPVTTALYPTCSGTALKSANLNNGVNSAIIEGDGPDLWYSLNAQYNTLRASLSAAFGDNEIRLYHVTNGCFELLETEHEVYTASSAATGNQILISDNLTVGETYYVAVHRASGISNTSAKVCFNHFVGTTCDHYYSNNTGIYSSVCTSFKAQYKGNATNYIFNVLSATQNNTDLNITPWSYTTTTSNSVVPRLGTIFPVNMSASAKVYTLNIPVVYAIPDAAGNYTSITANATSTCTVTLNPELPVALRASDRCPNTKNTTSSISIDRTVCGAMRYEWEFTQQIPSVQPAVTVLGGMNTTVFFLNNVPGMGTGKTYNVRVRPVHASGEVGNWGTSYCLKTGTSGMTMEDPAVLSNVEAQSANLMIFPNPVSGQTFTLVSNQFEDENLELTITDVAGKLVMKRKVTFSGQQVQLDCATLSNGLYVVTVGNQHTRLVVNK
ncbi:MAG: hypothetical protein RL609_1453 [Bacteroidota bacterium]